MRLKVKTAYGFKPTPEQLAALKTHDPNIDVYPDDHKYKWDRGNLKSTMYVDPAELYADVRLRGIQFTIDGGEVESGNLLTILSSVQQALNRIGALSLPVVVPPTSEAREQLYNERVNVHVPGLGLLIIDEVKVLYDQCTDGLQEALDEGWRIVACCPQPDRRRPDYVMGRKKP